MKRTAIIIAAAILTILPLPHTTCQAQDAVYKLLRQEWTVNADGTSDYRYRHEVQILRHRTLTAYADKGETFVTYNPDLEELTVNEVYTIQKDGTRVEMPQNAFIYQLPAECADCGRFNHLRELAMVHTGMEIGCTVVVDYTIHRRYNLLYERIPLWRDYPVEKLEVKVNYPSDMDMHFDIVGNQYLDADKVTRTMTATKSEDSISPIALHYELTDMPQAPAEPYMPDDIVPTLRLFNGTPQYVPEFDRNGLAASKPAVGKLINSTNPKVNVVAVRNYVADNIHLNDIEPAHLGYYHATAAEVWQSGCGTAIEKAVLLAAMLNEWGYKARVIGDGSDEVGITIDTLEYRLSATTHSPLTLYGEAKEEVTKVDATRKRLEVRPDSLADGFFQLKFKNIPEAPGIDAKRLALTRTTPLVTPQCDINVHDEYVLEKGLKMVGGKVTRKLAFDGIGCVEVTVKQSCKKLVVDRKLKIEKNTIATADYAKYRQLMALWQTTDRVLLKKK